MPSLRLAAMISSASLLVLFACKYEPDDKPAADPLEDPWVNAIDTGDDGEPAMAAAPPAPIAAPPSESGALGGEQAVAVAEPGDAAAAEPATGVLASPAATGSSPTASKSAASGDAKQPDAAALPEPGTEPVEAPSGEAEAAPAAEPTPAAPVAEPAKPAGPPPITIADFHGNYRFVGGSAQRSDLEAAIEAAADQLPGAIRGIGRKRLTKTNPIDDTLDIVVSGDKVKTIFETGFDAECVIDGATIHWTSSKGDKYKVRIRAKGSKLVQVIEGEDGVKTTVFVLSADKQKLTVHHKITADRLPEPMTYRLSYSRK